MSINEKEYEENKKEFKKKYQKTHKEVYDYCAGWFSGVCGLNGKYFVTSQVKQILIQTSRALIMRLKEILIEKECL